MLETWTIRTHIVNRLLRTLPLILILVAAVSTPAAAAEPTAMHTATQLVDAFNERDPDAMAALVSPDFELYYVSQGKAELSAQGADDLRAQMVDYFASQPSVRSVLEASIDGPRFVSFRERAITIVDGVERSASSIAVYEVVDGLILRVWYYPAEAARQQAAN